MPPALQEDPTALNQLSKNLGFKFAGNGNLSQIDWFRKPSLTIFT
jgi:hypothetical protein